MGRRRLGRQHTSQSSLQRWNDRATWVLLVFLRVAVLEGRRIYLLLQPVRRFGGGAAETKPIREGRVCEGRVQNVVNFVNITRVSALSL